MSYEIAKHIKMPPSKYRHLCKTANFISSMKAYAKDNWLFVGTDTDLLEIELTGLTIFNLVNDNN